MGFVVLVLVVLRLAMRMGKGGPAPYVGLTTFERIASSATHHLLYLLLFAMPIAGWLMTNAYSASLDVSVFGLFTLPHLIGENKPLFGQLQQAHKIGGITMAVLVFLHIGGALMHTFIKCDTVLWRMLPRNWGSN